MRIKELSLLGYKSFATRTHLLFPAGLTAIVGPNGSGKSNVSDAVRWVLGEGRSSTLRARSADEMIFAGSEKRPRAGLAEVSLTLDNSDGWLDVDYAEVVITRRAERDSPGQYLINGARVRLRDVLDLLGSRLGGGAYSVIGQGLVDQFLSMNPSQRRQLIDEAAGIRPLQRRRDVALRKLAETDENLTRVRDIIGEIGPRMRRMERLAERAARHRVVATELHELLCNWYAFHMRRANLALGEAHAQTATAAKEREEAKAAVEDAHQALTGAREAADAAERELEERRLEREAISAETARRREHAAVVRTRLEALEAREEDLRRQLTEATEREAELHSVQQALADGLAALEADLELRRAMRDAAQVQLRAREHGRVEAQERLEAARDALVERRGALAASEARRSAITADLDARRQELAAAAERTAAADESHGDLDVARAAAERAFSELDHHFAVVEDELRQAEETRTAAAARMAAAREASALAEARVEALRTRAGAVDALFGELGAAEEVLERLRTTKDLTLRGTVAELLQVNRRWEAAVAAALGHRAKAIVLADERAIDRALGTLEQGRGGRGTTLVPLSAKASENTVDVDIATSPDAPGLADRLLASTAFVAKLEDARAAVSAGAPRASTEAGLLVEADGTVTMSGTAREVLEVARERRTLPEALALAEQAATQAATAIGSAAEALRGEETVVNTAAEARSTIEGERRVAGAALERAQAAWERGQREKSWSAEARQRLQSEIERLEQDLDDMTATAATVAEAESVLVQEADAAQEAMEFEGMEVEAAALAAATAALAELSETTAAQRARHEAVENELAATRKRSAEAHERLVALMEERAALYSVVPDLAVDTEDAREGSTSDTELAHEPLEIATTAVNAAQSAWEDARLNARKAATGLEEARQVLNGVERRHNELRLGLARAEDRLERLNEQLTSDAELMPQDGNRPRQLTAQAVAAGADGIVEPDGEQEIRIASLRNELRAIGAIDHDALEAYEETAARQAYLEEQRSDLHAADADLRQVIHMLEEEMSERFDSAFSAVAAVFARYFPQLFGGGEAELCFVSDEENEEESEGTVGVDIVARPPGKRRQPLSLLSGGERALTAVALIFALLEVSRTPFVVLDEVDAALDEANVDRFRSCLQQLAKAVQVVIITHNRATVQSAGAIYGVTMGEDGASRIVSLRVDEAA